MDLRWERGQTQIHWAYAESQVHKTYPAPPGDVLAWPDPPSVIVIEAQDESNPRVDNAVVLNPDGTERLRLEPPAVVPERHWNIGFYTIYAEPGGLVAVFSTQVGDYWGRPDLHTGKLSNIAQWR